MNEQQMRRRQFITLLGGAAAAWPLAVRAQQPTMPVVGYLDPGALETSAHLVAAFRKGLSEAGYVEGRNVAIEFRWGQNDFARLPELAADLVRRRVAVIATPGSMAASLAAKTATASIPIVFGTGGNPVRNGLVASLNPPGGNITGISYMNVEIGAKRLGLLHELLPGAARIAALARTNVQPDVQPAAATDLQAAASSIGRNLEVLYANTNREIDTAFARLVQMRADALLITPDPLFRNRRVQIVSLAARHAMPAIYYDREFAEVGGLMSYGSNIADQARQTVIYVGRILKGEKPSDLPVMQPTRFEFVINQQTASLLGLTVPPTLLAIADEVIE